MPWLCPRCRFNNRPPCPRVSGRLWKTRFQTMGGRLCLIVKLTPTPESGLGRPIGRAKPCECVGGQRTELRNGLLRYRMITMSNMKRGNICPCPTPRGVEIGWGWDTSTHGEALWTPKTGRSFFVPGVHPLDALPTGVRARAPVETRSRGGTPGTKSETGENRRHRLSTAASLSTPYNPACGTPFSQRGRPI